MPDRQTCHRRYSTGRDSSHECMRRHSHPRHHETGAPERAPLPDACCLDVIIAVRGAPAWPAVTSHELVITDSNYDLATKMSKPRTGLSASHAGRSKFA